MNGAAQLLAADGVSGAASLAPASVALVFADLPYGKTQNAWDRPIDLAAMWAALHHACRPDAPMVFTAQQPFASKLVMSNEREFRFDMVWEKNKPSGFLNAKKRPLVAHENILVFYREPPCYVPQMTDGHPPMHAAKQTSHGSGYGGRKHAPVTKSGTTLRYPTTVLKVPVVNNDDPEKIHATQKPEPLVEWFIRTYTRVGDLVLDPTAGSGTTLAAAVKLGRRAVGFELDPKIASAARRRIDRAIVSRLVPA